MLSNRLGAMVACSLIVAIASSLFGHLLAISLPHVWGFKSANSAAMVAVTSGCLLVLAIFVGPKRGLLWRWLHQRELLRRILAEDILALFYRHVEAHGSENLSASDHALSVDRIASKLQASAQTILSAMSDLVAKQWVSGQGNSWNLTPSGYQQAQILMRTHRLWEHYLREETGISDPRLHATAESLEPYTSSELRESLGLVTGGPTVDPHGKQIPPETP